MLYGTAVWLVIATCCKVYNLKELEWLLGLVIKGTSRDCLLRDTSWAKLTL